MSIETNRWDAADHLTSIETVVAYLEAVLEDGDDLLVASALNDVAPAPNDEGGMPCRRLDSRAREA